MALQWLTGGTSLLDDFALWPSGRSACAERRRSSPGSWSPMRSCTTRHLGHSVGNMFALYMFGPDVERVLGSRRFALYYFACVIGAALTQLWVAHSIYPEPYPTLGASGGIFGILLLSTAWLFPHRKLMLLFFPPIPMPAWLFVTLYGMPGAVAGRVRQHAGRGAFRPPGRHGDRLRADPVLAHPLPPALSAERCATGAR